MHTYGRLAFVVVVIALCASASVQNQAPADAARAEAIQGLQQMWKEIEDGWRKRDRAAFERAYADEFRWIHPLTLGIVDKAGQIEQMLTASASGAQPPARPQFENITLFGDFAVLRREEPQLYATQLFVKRQGRWQTLQLQGTSRPQPRKTVTVSRSVLESYAGRYEQAPGQFATVTATDNGLRISFPIKFEWSVQALSDEHFFVPNSLNQILFHKDDNGRVKYYTAWLANGEMFKGTRVE